MTTTKYLDILLQGIQKQYQARNFNQALELSNQALVVAKRHKEIYKVNDILIKKAKIFKRQGIYTKKDQNFKDALQSLQSVNLLDKFTSAQYIIYHAEYTSILIHQDKIDEARTTIENILNHKAAYNEPKLSLTVLLAKAELAIAEKEFSTGETLLKDILDNANYNDKSQYLIQTYTLLLKIYTIQGKFGNMAKYAELLLPLSNIEQDLEAEAIALNSLGISHAMKGEYKSAFEHFTAAIEKSNTIRYTVFSARALVNLGVIFSELRNFEEALKIYQRINQDYADVTTDYTKTVLFYNIGGMYIRLQDFNNSVDYFKKALKAARFHGFSFVEYKCLYELSRVYIEKGHIEKGLEYAKETQAQKDENESLKTSEVHLINRGTIYNRQSNYETALEYLLKGIKMCEKRNNYKTLIRGYQEVALAYKKLGNHDKAYNYLELHSKENERFLREMRKRQMIDLEIKYEMKEKEREITLLKDKMKIQTLELNHQKEIEAQNQKLKMANEELKQFTYAISHDLKEPLRMISSFSKLWYRKNKKQMDATDQEFFDYIHGGAIRMTTMLNGLLDYATLGSTSRNLKEVNLNEVLLAVQEILTLKVQETNAIIEVHSLPIIKTKRLLVFQLFQNLLSNALKFMPEGRTPYIQISTVEKKEAYVISIKDNGIGIPPKQQKSIFSIFKRLHTRDQYEGTGLGLALCKKIVHHLNGKIWLESKEGEGTTFFFSLPKKMSLVL